MMRSFYNGVSGVKTHSFGMDLLANNISNINTVGYKAAMPEFKDIFYQTGNDVGGLNNFGANQVGLAASGLSSTFSQKQGALVSSQNTFDVALEGKGFYGIKDYDGNTYYTRNGAFNIDSDFNLVDSFGRFVLGTMNAGFNASAMSENIKEMFGKVSSNAGFTISNNDLDIKLNAPNAQTPITLPRTLFMNAVATTNVNIKANLSNAFHEEDKYINLDNIELEIDNNKSTFKASNLEPNARILLEVDRGDGSDTIEAFADEFGNLEKTISGNVNSCSARQVKTINVGANNKFDIATYDANGNIRKIDLQIQAIDKLNFKATAILKDTQGNTISEASGNIIFNTDGSLNTNELNQIDGINLNLGSPRVDGKGGYDGLTCIDNAKIERYVEANGYPAGVLKDYAIDERGNILANFTNGKSQAVAKFAVFNFVNEQGLHKNGENEFSTTPDSGNPIFFTDANGNVINSYKIKSNYLEQSNVDLGTELTQVIIFQKAYEANAKSITTADQMLKRAIEMKK